MKPMRSQDPTAASNRRCRPLVNVTVRPLDRVPVPLLTRRHRVFRPAMPFRRMYIVLPFLREIIRISGPCITSLLPYTARGLAIGLFSAFVALLATPTYAQTEVPSDWPLKPSGLSVGEEFRLMFMGENSQSADSTDIAVYDAYVQGRIAANGLAKSRRIRAITRSWVPPPR